ncbi:MAG TPA: hypothetical protein VLY20_08005 [Nitrospiria bacterium]|nr:hypothetical protein [Nitrospiria bacterium]
MGKNLTSVEKILSRIRKPVVYHYPGDEGERRGVLEDRTVLSVGRNPAGAFYWLIVDLIKFSGYRGHWIRIGYYRKTKERLVFAGQTTSTYRVSQWKRLLLKTSNEKRWFRKLIQDVAEETKK